MFVTQLPPHDSQPIIMAGLGTGAAPFRAFLQYRAHLAAQNIPVGPTYYYFGSRHRSQEYLYGEEIEAFITDGTITRAGLAFSRDQKHKIYIQDKMKEDGQDLVKLLLRENGVFYLCGPTWPVPDVFEALVDALGRFEGVEADKAGTFLEELKDEERYVLEVCSHGVPILSLRLMGIHRCIKRVCSPLMYHKYSSISVPKIASL